MNRVWRAGERSRASLSPLRRLRSLQASPYRRHVALTTLTSIATFSLGFITGPITARVLGPSGRGDLASVLGPTTVLAWLLPIGTPLAAAYYLGVRKEQELLSTVTVFGLVLGAPVCFLLWLFTPAYLAGHSDAAITWARIFLILMPTTVGTQAALEILRRRTAGLRWNLWRGSTFMVSALGIVALAAFGELTLHRALAVNFIGSFFPTIYLVWRLWLARPLRPSFSAIRLLVPYAWRTALAGTASSINSKLDQVILATAAPSRELGLYAVAATAASATYPLTVGIQLAMFGHLRGEDQEVRARARFRRSFQATLLVSVFAASVIGVFGPFLLRVLFGPAFEESVTPMRLLLPGQVALDVVGNLNSKLYAEGRPGVASNSAILGAVITMVGLALLIRPYGIRGAAAITTVANMSQVLYLWWRGGIGFSGGSSTTGEEGQPGDGDRSRQHLPDLGGARTGQDAGE